MTDTAPPTEQPMPSMRIAKKIAQSGLCSRREAEKIIRQGRVKVNQIMLESPAFLVSPHDIVSIDDHVLPPKHELRVFKLHKPKGVLTTKKDPQNRPTLYDIMPPEFRQYHTVGRLDFNTEGLLLLTNDGAFKRYLELPSQQFKRRYRVRMFGEPYPDVIKRLAKGVTIDDVTYRPIEVTIEKRDKANIWAMITLTEGKNREIRRVFEHFGYKVSRLIRVSYGSFHLGNMPVGRIEEIPIKILHEQFGKKLQQFLV